jgi:hypothetical protein
MRGWLICATIMGSQCASEILNDHFDRGKLAL